MRSLYDNIVAGSQVSGQVVGASVGTLTGAAVDTKGYNTGVINVHSELGSAAATTSAIATLLECATSNGTFTPALANDGTTIQVTLGSTGTGLGSGGAAGNGMARIEGLGLNRKRYLKAQVVYTFAAAQTITGFAEILLGRAFNMPTQTGSNSL